MISAPTVPTATQLAYQTPKAGHELNVVVHDTEDERQMSRGVSPVAIETLRAWLRQRTR
jgi:hypothetical protein